MGRSLARLKLNITLSFTHPRRHHRIRRNGLRCQRGRHQSEVRYPGTSDLFPTAPLADNLGTIVGLGDGLDGRQPVRLGRVGPNCAGWLWPRPPTVRYHETLGIRYPSGSKSQPGRRWVALSVLQLSSGGPSSDVVRLWSTSAKAGAISVGNVSPPYPSNSRLPSRQKPATPTPGPKAL